MQSKRMVFYGAGVKGKLYLDFMNWSERQDQVIGFCDKRFRELGGW